MTVTEKSDGKRKTCKQRRGESDGGREERHTLRVWLRDYFDLVCKMLDPWIVRMLKKVMRAKLDPVMDSKGDVRNSSIVIALEKEDPIMRRRAVTLREATRYLSAIAEYICCDLEKNQKVRARVAKRLQEMIEARKRQSPGERSMGDQEE